MQEDDQQVFKHALMKAHALLQDTERRMQELDSEKTKLEVERMRLRGFIKSLHDLLSPQKEVPAVPSATAADVALMVLKESNAPLNLAQMELLAQQRGFPITRDALRMAMVRRPDLFESVGGNFRLRVARVETLQQKLNAIKEK